MLDFRLILVVIRSESIDISGFSILMFLHLFNGVGHIANNLVKVKTSGSTN